MFVMTEERLVWWKVRFRMAAEDGSVAEHEIEMRFVVLDEADFPQFAQKFLVAPGGSAEPTPAAVAARFDASVKALLEVVRDWRGVMAVSGEPLPFNPENFRRFMKLPLVMTAVGNAYVSCRNAAPEVREGN